MKRLLILVLLLLAPLAVRAQDVRVSAEVDSNRFMIGDWIHLRLSVDAPAGVTVRLPSSDDDIENGEFVSAEEADVEREGDRRRYRQELVATVFDTGSISLRVRVRYTRSGDTTTFESFSPVIALELRTIALDTTQTFKDIKDVLDVPLTFWDYLLYAAIALLLALTAWLVWRWYRRRAERPVEEVIPEQPEIPVDVLALRALERLRERRLWQGGEHKAYQSELTDILRGYIEHRYRIPAMEQPTSEIMPAVAMLGLPPAKIEDVERVLRVADMTKFARYTPSSMQHEEGMRVSVDFVESTRPAASMPDAVKGVHPASHADGPDTAERTVDASTADAPAEADEAARKPEGGSHV